MLPAALKRVLPGLGLAAAAAAMIALIRDTAYNGHDFAVFWRAGRSLIDGEPLYSVARDGAAAFKYPPWIAPAFVPFALLPLAAAKWAWGLVQVASLAVIARSLAKGGVRPAVIAGSLILFWGVFATHALDGQCELPLVALILLMERRAAVVFWALSAKVFTLVSAFLVPRARWVRGAAIAALACMVLSLPAWRSEGYGNPAYLVRSWAFAARSGGTEFVGEKIRGRDNQGFPALVLRAASVPASRTEADPLVAFAIALALTVAWAVASRGLAAADRTAGWLGLAAVAHPLAWFHLFVFAFPLAARSIQRAVESRRRISVALAVLGAVLIAAVTRKTLGPAGAALELASVKSWGVLLCLWGLRVSARSS